MPQINLSVQGMTCGSCVKHVTKALEVLDGVESVHVDLQSGRVQVGRTTDQSGDLIHALDEEGYPSSLDLDEQSAAPAQKNSGGCCCG
ncbi:heavy-metal-associated domain-containing protein [Polynucleobacter sp. Ross1-W9]|uniref:heavy-metal-associated domain-containing protein n=1 Tax=Polynucleobacter parvulilacunae TaxID=1855631 RepID=UPI001C0E3606|nr:heavy metal-associated domain-containing protein [Polynucleobacter parvulilacunae]MBU3556270.1 heavy-metal-associated domain-containing protein [Polynucleobacter parvulilacunae]